MESYTEMRQRHQEEFNALPLGFAFSRKQFEEMMGGWGLHPERDLDKIFSIPGGGYIQKKDSPEMHRLAARQEKEMQEAASADPTGDGFIYQMFLAELADHEYGYTGDCGETLDSLGYTREEVTGDKRLLHGLEKAMGELMG